MIVSRSKSLALGVFFILLLAGIPLVALETAYVPGAGKKKTAIWRGDWHDAARDRRLPVKIYYPKDKGDAPCPVIVFSHGLGASREDYGYLGEYWAAQGYVCVHLQHPGSDSAVMDGAGRLRQKLQKLKAAAMDPDNYVDRPADVAFALDRLSTLSADSAFPLHGRMDLDNIGVAGHSFGAYTVMAVAGQAVGKDGALRYYGPEARLKAGIAMSGDPAQASDLDAAYERVEMPIFHMTGTADQVGKGQAMEAQAMIGNTTAAERRIAYDHTGNAPAYLLTFKDGDHQVFSGRERKRGGGEHDAAYRKIICIASTAFWDANLKNDGSAKIWLEDGGFGALLASSGSFEWKKP